MATATDIRSVDEIVAEIHRIEAEGRLLDFRADTLINFLPYEAARPWLKDDATPASWTAAQQEDGRILTRDGVLASMRDYMEFAWTKATGHRGLSASRSIDRMQAYAFLLNDAELSRKIRTTAYQNYGAPKLAVICQHLSFPMPDDRQARRMAGGLPCRDDCEDGCGEA